MITEPTPTASWDRPGRWTRLRTHAYRYAHHGGRPTPAALGYAAALSTCTAATEQIAVATDPWVRELALIQWQSGQYAASLLAYEIPDPWIPDAHGWLRSDAHRRAAHLGDWIAATERCLSIPSLPLASTTPGLSPDPAWVGTLTELADTPDPAVRARLVLTLGFLVDDGTGPVTSHLIGLAGAYLQLSGRPRRDARRLHTMLAAGCR